MWLCVYLPRWSFLCVLLISLSACDLIPNLKPSEVHSIHLADFPPKEDNGMPDEKLRLEQTIEPCGASNRGRVWEVHNVDALDRTITYHVQIDRNHAQEQYPQWITQTVQAGSLTKIPICDIDPQGSHHFVFAPGGSGWGHTPAWPAPSGNTAQQVVLLIQNREHVTWLINRHHQHPITVVYQLAGQNRETLLLEALAYQSVGSMEGVIHSASYADH
jgi:hypothetical protein